MSNCILDGHELKIFPSGGQLKPDWYVSYPGWSEKYGREQARSLSFHERAHLEAFKAVLDEEKIECSFRVTNAWEALMTEVETDRAFSAYDEAVKVEGKEYVEPLIVIRNAEEAEKATTIRGAVGAISIPAGQMYVFLPSFACELND